MSTVQIANFASCLGKYDATVVGPSAVLDISTNLGTSDLSLNQSYVLNTNTYTMPTFTSGGGISFTGWFYPTATSTLPTPIFDISTNSSGHIVLYMMGTNPVLTGSYYGNTVSTSFAVSPVLVNQWNFFCYTVECSGVSMVVQNIYLNGNLANSVSGGTFVQNGQFLTTRIGYGTGTYANYFTGRVDDFRAYKRVVTTMECNVLWGYNYGSNTLLAPTIGTMTLGTLASSSAPFYFGSTGIYNYFLVSRTPAFPSNTFLTVSASSLVPVNATTYVWTDPTFALNIVYTYTFTPYVSTTSGPAVTFANIVVYTPPTAITGLTFTNATNTSFVLTWSGGVAAAATTTFTVNGTVTTPASLGTGTASITGITTPATVVMTITNVMGTVTATLKVPKPGKTIVAFGYGNGSIIYTNDGINWAWALQYTGQTAAGIIWTGTKYLAIFGGNVSATSTDGINWTMGTTSNYANCGNAQSIAYGNGIYVSVAYMQNYMSRDGITWTSINNPLINPNYTPGGAPQCVLFQNGIFVVGSYIYQNQGSMFYYSSDGINWTVPVIGNPWPSTVNQISTIVYGNNIWVAYGSPVSWGQALIPFMYSTNGINWNLCNISCNSVQIPSGNAPWYHALAFGNGIFFAVSNMNNPPIYSTNGTNWYAMPNYQNNNLYFLGLNGLNGLRWINNAASSTGGYWVLGGSNNHGNSYILWYSTDGCVWTGSPSGLTGGSIYSTAGYATMQAVMGFAAPPMS